MTKKSRAVNFAEALSASIKGKKIDVYYGTNWSRYGGCMYSREQCRGYTALIDDDGNTWWPTAEQAKEPWHIKPEINERQ